jgi:curved DNA-binding protein
MEFKDYYKTLGVSRTATAEEIKRAYRQLARKYHPDVSKLPDAEARFKEMKEAYEVLKDPEKRSAYDQFGADWKAGQEFKPPPDWQREYSFGNEGFTDASQFSDFFDALFGRHGRGRTAGGGGFRDLRARGEDIDARIAIPIEEAYRGGTRQIKLDVAEPDDNGRVVQRRRTLNVKVPKGITAGQRIRLEGQGGPGLGGGKAGHLYIAIDFQPHPIYRAKGRDIHVSLPIAPWEAALGRTVQTPTLGGPVELKIPPGSSSGKMLRLKGRGLPGDPPGDQLVELEIVVPQKVSDKARELYDELEREQRFNPREKLGS